VSIRIDRYADGATANSKATLKENHDEFKYKKTHNHLFSSSINFIVSLSDFSSTK
jgi:hypothetical protein